VPNSENVNNDGNVGGDPTKPSGAARTSDEVREQAIDDKFQEHFRKNGGSLNTLGKSSAGGWYHIGHEDGYSAGRAEQQAETDRRTKEANLMAEDLDKEHELRLAAERSLAEARAAIQALLDELTNGQNVPSLGAMERLRAAALAVRKG